MQYAIIFFLSFANRHIACAMILCCILNENGVYCAHESGKNNTGAFVPDDQTAASLLQKRMH
jgi:hypothetical protein